jgi:hydrogenase maturation factor HypF (carbamoyltransferase family)
MAIEELADNGDAAAAVERILRAVDGIDKNDAIVALTHALCEVSTQHFSASHPDSIASALTDEIKELMPEYFNIANQMAGVNKVILIGHLGRDRQGGGLA